MLISFSLRASLNLFCFYWTLEPEKALAGSCARIRAKAVKISILIARHEGANRAMPTPVCPVRQAGVPFLISITRRFDKREM